MYLGKYGEPAIEIHAVRPALRRTIDGGAHTDIVVEITQRRRGYFDPGIQEAADAADARADPPKPDFIYRAGCTVLIDPRSVEIRRVIRTRGHGDR